MLTPNQENVVVPEMITAFNAQDIKIRRPMVADVGQWTWNQMFKAKGPFALLDKRPLISLPGAPVTRKLFPHCTMDLNQQGFPFYRPTRTAAHRSKRSRHTPVVLPPPRISPTKQRDRFVVGGKPAQVPRPGVVEFESLLPKGELRPIGQETPDFCIGRTGKDPRTN